jgi:hypothetical protein
MFVRSDAGFVYSLDAAAIGCVYWSFEVLLFDLGRWRPRSRSGSQDTLLACFCSSEWRPVRPEYSNLLAV